MRTGQGWILALSPLVGRQALRGDGHEVSLPEPGPGGAGEPVRLGAVGLGAEAVAIINADAHRGSLIIMSLYGDEETGPRVVVQRAFLLILHT